MQRVSPDRFTEKENAMTRRPICLAGLLLAVFMAMCSKTKSGDAPIVFTSILPQKDFVRHIAGERLTVVALVGPGQSPHSYTPAPDQMAQLSEAAAFFRIGVEVEEGLLPKIEKGMPNLRIIDLRKGIELRDMVENHDHDHDHNHHGGKDPHVWLSPPLVKKMAVTIKDALIEIDPEGRHVYEENLEVFHRKLDSLDAHIQATMEPLKGTRLFVFHPAFGYFAEEYGLIQKPVETGGKEPSARDLAELVEEAREHKPGVIFVQPQYSRKSAETLARQIGCAVVPINPLPADYLGEMREMCAAIQTGLSGNE
jgi:zinc transport system substrate-binding protein